MRMGLDVWAEGCKGLRGKGGGGEGERLKQD